MANGAKKKIARYMAVGEARSPAVNLRAFFLGVGAVG